MRSSPTAAAVVAALIGALAPVAVAQVQPGMPTGPTQAPQMDKPEGVAEQAPKAPGVLPTTPVLPPPKSKRKKFQVFELDGYFRFRTDWFKKFDLGFNDDPALGGAPFRNPLGCDPSLNLGACSDRIRSANMRLRLEPVINLDEKSSVHFQVDIYDNFVLGSTPDGTYGDGTPSPTNIPIKGFSSGMAPPQAGRNYNTDSIVVKRAWAEIMTPLGLLKFGRQPSHWGMGVLANGGGRDPFSGQYDLDADYGDSADRVLFGTMIPGTDFRFALATDWASTSPTSAQTDVFANRSDGQPFDLDDEDDVRQWIFMIAQLNTPEEFQDLRDQGELAINYGGYLVWRKQRFDQTGLNIGADPDTASYNVRGAEAFIPDLYVKLAYKKFMLEAEGVWIKGSIDNLEDVGVTKPDAEDTFDINQLGGVMRIGYLLMDDDLELGFETGFATGDQWDNSPQGATNVRDARGLPGEGDLSINAFRFDFDYKVDLILFRELLGTVTNAIYAKPTLRYNLTDRLTFKGQGVVSFAHKPIATPGNSSMYGIELDGDLGYENDGFFAGISYGVLFPLAAMDHPADEAFGYGTNTGSAATAQTIQTRLVLQF